MITHAELVAAVEKARSIDPLSRAEDYREGTTVRRWLDAQNAHLDLCAAILNAIGEPQPPRYEGKTRLYTGREGGTEHRTCGDRAWCHQCAEWCSATASCPCCDPPVETSDLTGIVVDALRKMGCDV